jgi:predicted lactoylglutathione lyase
MARKTFLNLPVKDLQRSIAFFTGLGFTFNAQFTDDTAACMIISGDAYVMLLAEQKFRNFTTKAISDTSNASEAIIALDSDSRAGVDEFADKALASGGTPAMPAMDLGFMYGRSFYDPDGHHWEIFHMNPGHVEKG